MSDSLSAQIRGVIWHARGLSEPWPDEFENRLKICIEAIRQEGDSAELKKAADELDEIPDDVPNAVGIILARVLYDNMDMPVSAFMAKDPK